MGKAVAMKEEVKEVEGPKQSNTFIPPSAMLDRWSKHKWTNGVQISELRELDTICVETNHHTYEITIINPITAEVLVCGGEQFPVRTVASVAGASIGGSFLKVHGIYVGFKMELQIGKRRIVTSRVRSIALV
jgi:hypothetical protein